MQPTRKEKHFAWGKIITDEGCGIGPRYEHEIVERMPEWVKADDLCLDIGAHQGFYAILLASLVGENGIVHAFEPHPHNFTLLSQNAAYNKCKNINLHNVALGNQIGSTILHEWNGSFASLRSHLGPRRYRSGNDIEITIKKLDDFCFERKVNFIKMDVEAWETKVFKGGHKLIRKNKPIVLVETHGKANEEYIRQFGIDNGFKVEDFLIKNRRDVHLLLKPKD